MGGGADEILHRTQRQPRVGIDGEHVADAIRLLHACRCHRAGSWSCRGPAAGGSAPRACRACAPSRCSALRLHSTAGSGAAGSSACSAPSSGSLAFRISMPRRAASRMVSSSSRVCVSLSRQSEQCEADLWIRCGQCVHMQLAAGLHRIPRRSPSMMGTTTSVFMSGVRPPSSARHGRCRGGKKRSHWRWSNGHHQFGDGHHGQQREQPPASAAS